MDIQKYKWIIYTILITSLSTSFAMGADSMFCKKYAQRAVGQFYIAKFHKMPNIIPPAWQENYEAHKKWCELPVISENMARNETRKRANHIKKNYKQKNCNAKRTILPNGKVKIKYPNGKVKEHSLKKYANIDINNSRVLYKTNVPFANMPEQPSTPQENIWLHIHAEVLLDIIRTQVDDEGAFQNYTEFEGDDLSIFKKIDSRSQVINYLISP